MLFTNSLPQPDHYSKLITFYMSLMLLVSCYTFFLFTGHILLLIITLVASLLALLNKKTVRISNRSIIYSFTIAMVAAFFTRELSELSSIPFFLPVDFLFPLYIYSGICCLFLRQRFLTVCALTACVWMSNLAMGSALNEPENFSNPFFEQNLPLRHFLFIFTVTSQVILLILLMYRHMHESSIDAKKKVNNKKWLIRWTSLTLVLGLTIFSSYRWPEVFPYLEKLIAPYTGKYSKRNNSRSFFPEQVSLNHTVDLKQEKEMKKPALYIKSKIAPGYLRGRTYDTYKDGLWKNSEAFTRKPVEYLDESLSIGQVNLSEKKSSAEQLHVFIARNLVTDVLYTNGNVNRIDLIAESISTNGNGVYKAQVWDKSAGYSFSNVAGDPFKQEAASPRGEPSKTYLEVPQNIQDSIQKFTTEINVSSDLPTERKMQFITAWLRENIDYSLEPQKFEYGVDPVIQFLTKTKRGHCELFASANIMIFRQMGIPARYVSGFVTFQNSGNKDDYIAHMGDAHAWVEAWVDGKGWVLFEPTPASAIPTGQYEKWFLEVWKEKVSLIFASVLSDLKRGYFAEAIWKVLGAIGQGLSNLFTGTNAWVSWPILILVIWTLYKRKNVQQTSKGKNSKFDQELNKVQRLLFKYIRKKNLFIEEKDSLNDLSNKVMHDLQDPKLALMIDEYSRVIYGPEKDYKRLIKLKVKIRQLA
ncbi:MAG: transglutaminase domain-containing protein [Lentisphaeria bacterium]|nr:transglutaminase domain-containing protein [Lentisphaeria bacterium]